MKDMPLDRRELSWLTGLARALIGEAHAADDLVQETVMAALLRPPTNAAARRPWLRSVARRLAARKFRGEARRAQREERAARAEALPDSAELVARAEVAEQVAAATRALPEPFRRTLLLRFLEGLGPEEIAREEGLPVDTVRWRVRRGLELLRERLVRKHDRDWSSWSLLLTPLARTRVEVGLATAGAPGVLAGMVALGTTMKLMAGLVLVCGVVLWFVLDLGGARPEPVGSGLARAPERTGGEAELGTGAVRKVGPVERSDRTPAAPATVSARTERAPRGIRGRVVDASGAPIEGATVYLVTAVASEDEPAPVLARTRSDAGGAFELSGVGELLGAAATARIDLGAIAQGFLRRVVEDASQPPPSGWELVLERGRTLTGRVVDEYGVGVPGLELLAHSASVGISHVSPTQTLLRAKRAQLGGAGSTYQHSLGRTDASGAFALGGLAEDEVALRSQDPGWTIEAPLFARADGAFVVWTAVRRLGVQVEVLERGRGVRVERADATFRARIALDDGTEEDFGQWVGSGEGVVSFVLGPDLPDFGSRRITRAQFHGTVNAGAEPVTWEAEPLEDPLGITGVARVTIEVDVPSAAPSVGLEAELPGRRLTATVELDVRYDDGAPFDGELAVDWVTRAEDGTERAGDGRAERLAPGRYRMALDAGDVSLTVAAAAASGSLAPWRGELPASPAGGARAFVTLARGAAVTIERPSGWSGEWFVHASWRPEGESSWRGSWTYSTQAEVLELSALRSAEWRFLLRPSPGLTDAPLERTVLLLDGERTRVSD